MGSIQFFWNHVKKTLRFVWRHFFTLTDLSLSAYVLIFHTLLWKNAFICLCIAMAIDWVKQFLKPSRSSGFDAKMSDPYTNIGTPLHIRQWWNPSVMGTGAYDLMRNHSRGSGYYDQ